MVKSSNFHSNSVLNSKQIPVTGWEGCGLPRNRKKIKPTKNQSIRTKYELDDMFLVIPGGRSGMFHFKVEIEESFSFCNLSVNNISLPHWVNRFTPKLDFGFFVEEFRDWRPDTLLAITIVSVSVVSVILSARFKFYHKGLERTKKMVIVDQEESEDSFVAPKNKGQRTCIPSLFYSHLYSEKYLFFYSAKSARLEKILRSKGPGPSEFGYRVGAAKENFEPKSNRPVKRFWSPFSGCWRIFTPILGSLIDFRGFITNLLDFKHLARYFTFFPRPRSSSIYSQIPRPTWDGIAPWSALTFTPREWFSPGFLTPITDLLKF